MMHWLLFLVLLLLTPSSAAINTDPNRTQCLRVAEKIRKLDSQLRQANSVTRSEKLKQRLRQWKKLRYQCRKRRFPIK